MCRFEKIFTVLLYPIQKHWVLKIIPRLRVDQIRCQLNRNGSTRHVFTRRSILTDGYDTGTVRHRQVLRFAQRTTGVVLSSDHGGQGLALQPATSLVKGQQGTTCQKRGKDHLVHLFVAIRNFLRLGATTSCNNTGDIDDFVLADALIIRRDELQRDGRADNPGNYSQHHRYRTGEIRLRSEREVAERLQQHLQRLPGIIGGRSVRDVESFEIFRKVYIPTRLSVVARLADDISALRENRGLNDALNWRVLRHALFV